MSRPHVDVAIPALALRRAQAAAALSVSLETFDQHIRPKLAATVAGGVTLYPIAELERWLTENAQAGAPWPLHRRSRTASGPPRHERRGDPPPAARAPGR